MQQILEEKLNKTIKEKYFKWNFEIQEEGIYGIEITASAKSWQQNFLKSFFKDDNLTVEIDSLSFLQKSISWNGNNLKGLKKTNLFVLKLNQENHILTFLASQSPQIETIRIYKVKENEISYLPKDNYPIQEGNGRQWLIIVFCNLGLQSLKIIASVKQGREFLFFQKDDSDLKLIINDEIQKNQELKSHKNWFWCGRTLKGNLKLFEKKLNLKPDLHYLEFWTDRNPEVEEIKIKIETKIYPIFTLNDIHAYAYKGVLGNEDYNRFDKEILEAVNFWNNVFSNQEYSPKKLLDPNLVKAIIYQESRIGYAPDGEIDIMQVGDSDNPALASLRKVAGYKANEFISKNKAGDLSYSFPQGRLPIKVESSEESIFWGVRWLYHKAQKYYGTGENNFSPPFVREWKTWEQAVIDYNGSNKKYEYQKKVWKIYKEGIDPSGNILWNKDLNGFSLIKAVVIIGIISAIFLTGWYWTAKPRDDFYTKKEDEKCIINKKEQEQEKISFSSQEADKIASQIFVQNLEEYKKDKNYYGDVFQETAQMCEKAHCYMEWIVTGYYDELVDNMKSNEQFLKATQVFDFMKNTQTGERNIQTGDIDNDGENEIVFVRRDVLNNDYIIITIIDKIEDKFKLIEKKIDEGYDGYIKLLDVTNDLRPEVLLFMSQGQGGYPLSIYQYLENKKLQKIFESEFSLFPQYTFSDLDLDGRMEIKMEGEIKDAIKDYRAVVEKIYEYNKEKNNFVKIKDIEKANK